MTDHSSASIRQPKNWQDFERNARILFECILNDIHVQNNGRIGQPQCGVDIFGRRNGEGTKWIGVQCKGKDAHYGEAVSEKELRREVEKTKGFTPPLSDFILITTSPDDAAIQTVARKITEEREQEGNPLSVSVWGWGELEARICEHRRALRAFHPDATYFTDQLLNNSNYLVAESSKNNDLLNQVLQMVQQTRVAVKHDDTSTVLEMYDKTIHAEIDGYRDLLRGGKALTALGLFEKLKARIWETSSDRIKFRLITNIASAKLHINKETQAAAIEHFLDAIKYQPEDKLALANVALAHLLNGDTTKAITAAQFALEKDNDNADAASYLIQAHIKDETIKNPTGLVTEQVVHSPSVDLGCLTFYRQRGDPYWVDFAKEAGKRHPNDEQISRIAAEAALEAALRTKGLLGGERAIEPIDEEALGMAANVMQKLWDNQYRSELPGIDASLPYNLIQIWRVLGDNAKAKAIALQAIDNLSDVADFIRLLAGLHIEDGNLREALSLLKRNGSDPESQLMLAEILAEGDPVEALKILDSIEQSTEIEPDRHIMIEYLRVECLLKHPSLPKDDRVEKAKRVCNALLEQFPNNGIVLLIQSHIFEATDSEEALKQTLSKAKSRLKNDSPFYERALLAKRFEMLDSYADAADALDGYVDVSHDNHALRILLRSLINSDRRGHANRLLQSIPPRVVEQPFFLRCAIALHFRRGDYASADSAIKKLLYITPNDLRVHLSQVDIWLRYRNEDEIKSFLSTEVENLEGRPEELMRLAQLLARYGYHDRSLKLGYKIHLENHRNAALQLAYMGLFLMPSLSEHINLQRQTVEKDTAFTIRNGSGEVETFIIEEDKSLQLTEETVPSTHHFATAAFGLTVGDKFRMRNTEEWEIILVKHKYLFALHSKMEHFERSFPENEGMRRFIVDTQDHEKSFEPLLQTIKERHDATELLFKTYSEKLLPLGMLAHFVGMDVIDAWHGLVQEKHNFKVCNGKAQERIIAMKCVTDNDKAGCVVDALTLHIIRVFGIEDVVVSVCGGIAATESTIDTFRLRWEKLLSHGDRPFMTVYWHNGQFYRDEISKDRLEFMRANADNELNWINQKVKILPAESSKRLPLEAERIKNEFSYSFPDPFLAAQTANMLLLCEDQPYREFGMKEFQLKSSWLQPVLMVALENGAISLERYCDVICNLVDVNHSYISIDAPTLLYILGKNEKRFGILSSRLFGKEAEIVSHLTVLISFLATLWKDRIPTSNEKNATNALLFRLFFGEWRNRFPEADPESIYHILRKNFNNERFYKHLSIWLKGYFTIQFGTNARINRNPNRTQKSRAKRKAARFR